MKRNTDAPLSQTIASTATLKLAQPPLLDLFYTPLEERFERITRLVRRALAVPVAAITLLDSEKQWFKSVSGWAVTELPREHSLCNLTIDNNSLVAISDTRADPTTSNHPLVVSPPEFRAYAGVPLTDDHGLIAGTLCVFDIEPRVWSEADRQSLMDLAAITQRELAEDQYRSVHAALTAKLGVARREAMMDPLTRLWNRRGAIAMLESAVQQADRAKTSIALALVDLDVFKQINDTMGHPTGDAVLRKIGARIVGAVRSQDMACRIGGDEFLLVMVDCDASGANAIAERVRRVVTDAPIPTRDGPIAVTASVGFTIRQPGENASIDELLDRADVALRESKSQGRNRVRMAS